MAPVYLRWSFSILLIRLRLEMGNGYVVPSPGAGGDGALLARGSRPAKARRGGSRAGTPLPGQPGPSPGALHPFGGSRENASPGQKLLGQTLRDRPSARLRSGAGSRTRAMDSVKDLFFFLFFDTSRGLCQLIKSKQVKPFFFMLDQGFGNF